MVYVAILGHGVVGSGVAQVLRENADNIAGKAGKSIRVKRILDLREFPGDPYADRFTKNFDDILNDDDIRIVVETMGGLHPAYDFVKACLLAGKSVVTSNKELVAAKGDELLEIAKAKNVNFLFEASVGGGIPILRPLDQCLAANHVHEIAGILNGTTNFMLTKMFEEGMDFGDALTLAQKLGYAERDPSADVGGHDTCRKICILASLAFGKHVYPDQVYTEGIEKISAADVACAAALDRVIKLIGFVKMLDDGHLHCLVAPMLISKDSLLSDVKDVFNGIQVRGDVIGDVMFYGRGAGKLPTASAVVADIIDEVKHLQNRKTIFWSVGEAGYVNPADQAAYAVMLRFAADDRAAAIARVQDVWQNAAVLDEAKSPAGEIVVVTEKLTGDILLTNIDKLGLGAPLSQIRIAEI